MTTGIPFLQPMLDRIPSSDAARPMPVAVATATRRTRRRVIEFSGTGQHSAEWGLRGSTGLPAEVELQDFKLKRAGGAPR